MDAETDLSNLAGALTGALNQIINGTRPGNILSRTAINYICSFANLVKGECSEI